MTDKIDFFSHGIFDQVRDLRKDGEGLRKGLTEQVALGAKAEKNNPLGHVKKFETFEKKAKVAIRMVKPFTNKVWGTF